jgi:subtilisin family serine protease
MLQRSSLLSLAAAAAALVAAGCADTTLTQPSAAAGPQLSVAAPGGPRQYVLVGATNALPADLATRVAIAGGTITGSYPAIGVATVTAGDEFAAASIKGVQVVPDVFFQQTQPTVTDLDEGTMPAASAEPGDATVANTYANPYYFAQWGPRAVDAPAAWAAGYRGAGVRVAILDGGLANTHPDLAGAVDVAHSASFVPGKAFNTDAASFWHGTHVAGIVGARDNTIGVVGIAPSVTLIGVKVLENGSGYFSWAIDGIMYASKPLAEGGAGAQVINMSLGATIDKGQPGYSDAGVRALAMAIDRATAYAWDHGVTVIAAAGNESTNLDDRRYISLPAQSNKVISVAATGPVGWAYGSLPYSNDFARQASYTNSGKAGVDLAAPGGDFAYPTNELCTVFGPTSGLRTNCWVFDMYLSLSRTGYSWAAGTSMASPVTVGVAALVIGKYNGIITPAGVRAKLQQGAIDLGKPGNDEVYGAGFVNAARSVAQ